MRRDVLDLRAFYATPLGAAARRMLARKVTEAWGDARGLDVLGVGYATPFFEALRPAARRVVAAMPAAQGVEVWPGRRGNLAFLADEFSLPLPNALFDRILCVHALEESESALELLRETARVLAPSGQVIVAVAARNGLWANAENTPFGHGRPYTRRQLEALLREADLEPSGWTRALYAPPWGWTAGWADTFESLGAWLWPNFSGVVMMEAVKQTFAVKPKGARARVRVFTPGALQPALPIGRAPGAVSPRALLEEGPESP